MSQEQDYVNLEEIDDVEYVNVSRITTDENSDDDGYLHPVQNAAINSPTRCQPFPGEMEYHPSAEPQLVKKKEPRTQNGKNLEANNVSQANNTLPADKTFKVYTEPFTCKKTPPSFGNCLLAINDGCIELRSKDNTKTFISWPLHFIRRYGFEKNLFRLEAGRRSESGEGQFSFFTPEGKLINDEISDQVNKRLVKKEKNKA